MHLLKVLHTYAKNYLTVFCSSLAQTFSIQYDLNTVATEWRIQPAPSNASLI